MRIIENKDKATIYLANNVEIVSSKAKMLNQTKRFLKKYKDISLKNRKTIEEYVED